MSFPNGTSPEQQIQQEIYYANLQQEVASLPPMVQQLYMELSQQYPPGEALQIAKREAKRSGLLEATPLTKSEILGYLHFLTRYSEKAEIEDAPPLLTHTHVTPDGLSGEAVSLPLQEIPLNQTLIRFYFCQKCGKIILVWEK